MCSLNWDNQSALINEIIPLPPCILSELSGDLSDSTEIYPNSEYQLGFDESIYGALLGINGLKPCKSNVVCSDSIPIMRNPARMITQSMMRDAISENCTRNPNFVKKCIDDFPEQQFRANKCSSRVPKRFEIAFESESRSKKQKTLPSVGQPAASISFSLKGDNVWEPDEEAMAEVKEMIYMEAAMRPINLGIDKPIEKPNKRKNVRISSDPQTVSARKRRERISERLGLLQRLVPGGDKLDTASMLDEAANYLKFLQSQVKELETIGHTLGYMAGAVINPMQSITLPPLPKPKP